APSSTSTARSAPMPRPVRSDSVAAAGPIVTNTTSASPLSLRRSASSIAFLSVAFNSPGPERSSVPSARIRKVPVGTCFTHTAIFMGRRSYLTHLLPAPLDDRPLPGGDLGRAAAAGLEPLAHAASLEHPLVLAHEPDLLAVHPDDRLHALV